MKWIILAAAALFAVSCSNESKWHNAPTADVNFEISADEVAGGAFKRGDAPAYIKEVRLSGTNTDYNLNIDEEVFDFGTKDSEATDDAIVMTGLTVGKTTINAVGNTVGLPFSADLDVSAAGVTTVDNLNTRANEYAAYMHGVKPLYAVYNGTVNFDVKTPVSGTQTIAMTTTNHRAAIVLENNSEKYNLIARVYKEDALVYTFGDATDRIVFEEEVSYVFNNADADGAANYKIEVDYYTLAGVFVKTIKPASFAVAERDDKTKLYQFNRAALETGDATFTFTWEEFTEENTGSEL